MLNPDKKYQAIFRIVIQCGKDLGLKVGILRSAFEGRSFVLAGVYCLQWQRAELHRQDCVVVLTCTLLKPILPTKLEV